MKHEKEQGNKRSRKWAKVRKAYLEKNPRCVVCNGTKNLTIHHIVPFFIHRHLELDWRNLITLCDSGKNGINCHLMFGHLGSYKSFNIHVKKDAQYWNKKILCRP